MLNVGFSELFLVVLAALLFIGPKDYPVVIRAIAKAIREFRALVDGVKGQVDTVMRESGVHDAINGTIIDLEGKKQPTYDISDLTQTSRHYERSEAIHLAGDEDGLLRSARNDEVTEKPNE